MGITYAKAPRWVAVESGGNREGSYAEAQRVRCSMSELERGFPGGAVVKNPPANAGDMGPSTGPGRSHMPQSN